MEQDRGSSRWLPPEKWSMYDLLEQREMWRGSDGTWRRIEDMRPEHRLNVSKFLLRHAGNVKFRYEWAMVSHLGFDMPDEVADMIDFSDMQNPMTWMTERPLYQALLAGLPEGGAALGSLRRRAAHHHRCQHSLRPEERNPQGAPCTCREPKPKGADHVAGD